MRIVFVVALAGCAANPTTATPYVTPAPIAEPTAAPIVRPALPRVAVSCVRGCGPEPLPAVASRNSAGGIAIDVTVPDDAWVAEFAAQPGSHGHVYLTGQVRYQAIRTTPSHPCTLDVHAVGDEDLLDRVSLLCPAPLPHGLEIELGSSYCNIVSCSRPSRIRLVINP
jgi:hypothetical protein